MPWNVDVTFAPTATRRTRRRHADELRRRNLQEEQCVAERAIAITTERMREYSAARLDAGAAPATVNKELAALRRMLTLGIGRKHREDVPMLHVENARTGFAIPAWGGGPTFTAVRLLPRCYHSNPHHPVEPASRSLRFVEKTAGYCPGRLRSDFLSSGSALARACSRWSPLTSGEIERSRCFGIPRSAP